MKPDLDKWNEELGKHKTTYEKYYFYQVPKNAVLHCVNCGRDVNKSSIVLKDSTYDYTYHMSCLFKQIERRNRINIKTAKTTLKNTGIRKNIFNCVKKHEEDVEKYNLLASG